MWSLLIGHNILRLWTANLFAHDSLCSIETLKLGYIRRKGHLMDQQIKLQTALPFLVRGEAWLIHFTLLIAVFENYMDTSLQLFYGIEKIFSFMTKLQSSIECLGSNIYTWCAVNGSSYKCLYINSMIKSRGCVRLKHKKPRHCSEPCLFFSANRSKTTL